MRILVIGGTGFIGPAVVKSLAEAGHEVTIFHRGRHEADLPTQVRHVHGSWENPGDFALQLPGFAQEFRHFGPDVVLYMTPADTSDCQAVMQVFRGITGRVVGISSIDVYRAFGRLHRTEPGPVDPIPLPEEAPSIPIVEADIRDLGHVLDAVAASHAEGIVHAAAVR